MQDNNQLFRDHISRALSLALEPVASVRAGWEGGSAAFDAVDAYSDIDLNFIVDDECSLERLYDTAERALAEVSRVTVVHSMPPGRYYKLSEGGEFLFVDALLSGEMGLRRHALSRS